MSDALTPRRVLHLFWPLALSWVFMAIEAPISMGVISRMPDAVVHTAAFTVMMALSLWIESPVIDLLSTSATLVKDRQSFLTVQRFAVVLMAVVTAVHVLVAFTPLYDWVCGSLMGIAPEVREAGRRALMIMTPWSAAIGWRRTLQGVLIRQGHTRAISFGTVLRMATVACVAFGLYHYKAASGVVIAAIALASSVIVEAVYVQIIAQPILREKVFSEPPAAEPLDMRRLWRFHFPLTGTTLVLMLASPMTAAALARTADPVATIAAYQLASSVVWMLRTITFALPELVITLARNAHDRAVLKKFSVQVGLACTGMMAVFAIFGLDRWVFATVYRAPAELVQPAHWVFLTFLLVPVMNAAMSYLRGVLTASHNTHARLWSMWVGMATLALAFAFGLAIHMPGLALAGFALTVGTLAEFLALTAFWSRTPRPEEPPAVHSEA